MHSPAASSLLLPATRDRAPHWLRPGIDEESVMAMCEAVHLLSMSFAWYVLSGQETIRATFPARGETLHLWLETSTEETGRLRLTLRIARDDETLAAWREGLVGETEIAVVGVRRHELPAAALLELARLDPRPYERWPSIEVGLARRRPEADEWHLALRALEAFDLLFDPLDEDVRGAQTRTLASGERVELAILDPGETIATHH